MTATEKETKILDLLIMGSFEAFLSKNGHDGYTEREGLLIVSSF
jgi:hypothetical protein